MDEECAKVTMKWREKYDKSEQEVRCYWEERDKEVWRRVGETSWWNVG